SDKGKHEAGSDKGKSKPSADQSEHPDTPTAEDTSDDLVEVVKVTGHSDALKKSATHNANDDNDQASDPVKLSPHVPALEKPAVAESAPIPAAEDDVEEAHAASEGAAVASSAVKALARHHVLLAPPVEKS